MRLARGPGTGDGEGRRRGGAVPGSSLLLSLFMQSAGAWERARVKVKAKARGGGTGAGSGGGAARGPGGCRRCWRDAAPREGPGRCFPWFTEGVGVAGSALHFKDSAGRSEYWLAQFGQPEKLSVHSQRPWRAGGGKRVVVGSRGGRTEDGGQDHAGSWKFGHYCPASLYWLNSVLILGFPISVCRLILVGQGN